LDLLVLQAAPAQDPQIRRVYGFLNDDMARQYLTPALAFRLPDRHDTDYITPCGGCSPRMELRW